MTVEQLIELLQEQNPHALVKIRSDTNFRIERFTVAGRNTLFPYGVKTASRDGYIHIECSLYSL